MACWRLKRNCSLSPQQSLGAWALPLACLLAVAAYGVVQGWWWVVAFALVDGGGLLAALWVYSRHALDGETVVLGDDGMLRIEQQRGQHLVRAAWPACQVRMEVGADAPITIRAGQQRMQVGAHATPLARQHMARELASTLQRDRFRSASPDRDPTRRA